MELLHVLTSALCALMWPLDLAFSGTGLSVYYVVQLPCRPIINVTHVSVLDLTFSPATTFVPGIPYPMTTRTVAIPTLPVTLTTSATSPPTSSQLTAVISHTPIRKPAFAPSVTGSDPSSAFRRESSPKLEAMMKFWRQVRDFVRARITNLILLVEFSWWFTKLSVVSIIIIVKSVGAIMVRGIRLMGQNAMSFIASQYHKAKWLRVPELSRTQAAAGLVILSLYFCFEYKAQIQCASARMIQVVGLFRQQAEPHSQQLAAKLCSTAKKSHEMVQGTLPLVFGAGGRIASCAYDVIRGDDRKGWISRCIHLLLLTILSSAAVCFAYLFVFVASYLLAIFMGFFGLFCVWKIISGPILPRLQERNERIAREHQEYIEKRYRRIIHMPGRTPAEAEELARQAKQARRQAEAAEEARKYEELMDEMYPWRRNWNGRRRAGRPLYLRPGHGLTINGKWPGALPL